MTTPGLKMTIAQTTREGDPRNANNLEVEEEAVDICKK